jgi:DNA-3-methyladenine glycosylase II
VAQFAIEHKLSDGTLKKLPDAEMIHLLTQIKGVGQWTVEMLLMFTLGRADVFAADDYGIQVAMQKLYNLDNTNKKAFKEQMQRIAQKWTPYRTYACMHLWRWKDAKQ